MTITINIQMLVATKKYMMMPPTMIAIEVTVTPQVHLENISSVLALQFATIV